MSRLPSRPQPSPAAGIAALCLIAVLLIGGCAINYTTRDTTVITVTDKFIKRKDSHDNYMVATDKGVFKDKDNLMFFKFNSADLYAKLKKGVKYKCEVNGFRFPIFSSFKNLLKCEPVAA